uniref:Zinc finger MYMtype protein 1like [Acyrthosiphon pisum] n=1 Tax=Lepeophtheirus salmonis TaxID=72036 RepID=A0A0K2VGN3_LEPSM
MCVLTEAFKKAMKDIEDSLKLRNLSKTRWLARSEYICDVWISFDPLIEALRLLSCSNRFNTKMTNLATFFLGNLPSMDFVISLIFNKNIMQRIHQMTQILKIEELNIIDATEVIKSTVKNLPMIRDDTNAINEEIVAAVMFLKKIIVDDPEAEFNKKHRYRKQLS